jgi:uncharacterized protein YegP (UPF0339 family)
MVEKCDELSTPEHGELYKDSAGQWRWRYVDTNGEITGDSSEGYENKIDCEVQFNQMFPDTELIEI